MRASLLETHAVLHDLLLVSQINHALHMHVTPWELHDWPLDYLMAAQALGERQYRDT